jgi:secretion/DNA translocation related TadE-like protein
VLWAVTVLVATAVVGWSLASALAARQRAEAAADLAALAAARGAAEGRDACGRAAVVATAGGARLATCSVAADAVVDVLIEVQVSAPWLRRLDLPPARARARAGPA